MDKDSTSRKQNMKNKVPLDYYAGPNIDDPDFVISNYIDLEAIRKRSSPTDWPTLLALVLGIILIISGIVWWFA